jgi:hypothetical protein
MSHYVGHAYYKLVIRLPQLSECWDYTLGIFSTRAQTHSKHNGYFLNAIFPYVFSTLTPETWKFWDPLGSL